MKDGKQTVPEEFPLVSSAICVNADICGIYESLPLFTLSSVIAESPSSQRLAKLTFSQILNVFFCNVQSIFLF